MRHNSSANGVSRWINPLAILLILGVSALIQGCTSTAYTGPELPHDETALVRTSGMAMVNGVTIFAVDEVRFTVPRRGVELAPGDHHLRVGIDYQRNADSALPIEFHALAGHCYLVQAEEQRSGYWHFWIEDRASGRIVSD